MIHLDEFYESEGQHCIDCDLLTESLRDLEQQCREAEDTRNAEAITSSQKIMMSCF